MSVSALRWEKDPDEVIDFKNDWSDVLDGDTIDTSTWIVPSGVTEDDSSNTTTTTTIWLSGGTLGQTYTIVNRVTTAGGRTYDQTARLKVKAH